MDERLQKILARAGVASRRHAEELIVEGRVTVNGVVQRELGAKADALADAIAVDGRPLAPPERHTYIMLNKPAGYVTTRADPEGRPTVYELLPAVPGLFSVGRLDQDTEGLLLLTTDGDWAQRIAHPRYNVEREYEVQVRGPMPPEALERLRAGTLLDDRWAQPVAAYEVRRPGFATLINVVMVEGRKREVRLLCASAGLSVKRLVRRRVGSLLLGWLETGNWRYLDTREVAALARRGREMPSPAVRDGREDGVRRQRGDERRAGAGKADDPHSNRRSGGLGQVHHRSLSGREPGLSVSGHRRDVSGRHRPGPGSRD
jgi:23S rRNA pseudouridine2605 synthase